MITKDTDRIAESDLAALIGRQEDRFIDFKVAWPHNVSLFEGVCAFANTLGGDIVIGIEAASGCASSLVGLPDPNVDATVLKWHQAIATALEPTLQGHVVHPVPLASRAVCYVIRVPAGP
jgi:predicted HTH transcriptional regulator